MRVAGLRWLKVRGFSSRGTALAADRPAPSSTETTGGRRAAVRRGAVGLLATALVTGSFAATATTAGAATTPVTLALTSGTFAPQGNTPKALPAATTPALVGTENTRTGTIKPATLTIPPQPQSNTGTKGNDQDL